MAIKEFPSPIGELHFSICYVIFLRSLFSVSVPYRGATFLNREDGNRTGDRRVSVPYRGATFLNTIPATPCSVWDR